MTLLFFFFLMLIINTIILLFLKLLKIFQLLRKVEFPTANSMFNKTLNVFLSELFCKMHEQILQNSSFFHVFDKPWIKYFFLDCSA